MSHYFIDSIYCQIQGKHIFEKTIKAKWDLYREDDKSSFSTQTVLRDQSKRIRRSIIVKRTFGRNVCRAGEKWGKAVWECFPCFPCPSCHRRRHRKTILPHASANRLLASAFFSRPSLFFLYPSGRARDLRVGFAARTMDNPRALTAV